LITKVGRHCAGMGAYWFEPDSMTENEIIHLRIGHAIKSPDTGAE
jgi:hypothetical protein